MEAVCIHNEDHGLCCIRKREERFLDVCHIRIVIRGSEMYMGKDSSTGFGEEHCIEIEEDSQIDVNRYKYTGGGGFLDVYCAKIVVGDLDMYAYKYKYTGWVLMFAV